MIPHIFHNRQRGGWGLFDLLCFIAACALIYPLAIKISHRYEGHGRIRDWLRETPPPPFASRNIWSGDRLLRRT